jgi:hypothetical protein
MTPQQRIAASYRLLDRRGKLLADLRALADGPGHTCTIISIAADELAMVWDAQKELVKALEWMRQNKGAHPENIARVAGDALACPSLQRS